MAPVIAVMMFFFGATGFNFINGKVISRNCSNVSCITPSASISFSSPSHASPSKNSRSISFADLNKSVIAPTTSHKSHLKSNVGIKVAKWDFTRVQTPFTVCIWILLGSVAKMGMKMLCFLIIIYCKLYHGSHLGSLRISELRYGWFNNSKCGIGLIATMCWQKEEMCLITDFLLELSGRKEIKSVVTK